MRTRPKKNGRPRLPKGAAKGHIVTVRFSTRDLRRVASAARADQQTVSAWIRGAVDAAIVA